MKQAHRFFFINPFVMLNAVFLLQAVRDLLDKPTFRLQIACK